MVRNYKAKLLPQKSSSVIKTAEQMGIVEGLSGRQVASNLEVPRLTLMQYVA